MSRPATTRLKVNPPLGQRPSLEFRRVNELRIDSCYQRAISAAASQTLIRRIAMFWDWALCQPLAVAKRADGGLYVVDGQHRLEAARMRGDIGDLPCVVTPYANAGDEAAAFVALNQQRRPLGRIDLFKAALTAEDTAAVEVMRLMRAAGLSLAPHTNYTAWKPGMMSNIGSIQECYRIHGERVTAIALAAFGRAFAGEVLRYAGTIFPGVYGFVAEEHRVEGSVDQDRLANALRSFTQKQWLVRIADEQARSGSRRQVAARAVIALRYRNSSGAVAPVVAPVSRPAAPAKPLPPELLPNEAEMVWCEQCDRRVSGAQVGRCTSPFCKAKALAA